MCNALQIVWVGSSLCVAGRVLQSIRVAPDTCRTIVGLVPTSCQIGVELVSRQSQVCVGLVRIHVHALLRGALR